MKSVFDGHRFILFVNLFTICFCSELVAQRSREDSNKITIGGFLDLYYSKNFSNPSKQNTFLISSVISF